MCCDDFALTFTLIFSFSSISECRLCSLKKKIGMFPTSLSQFQPPCSSSRSECGAATCTLRAWQCTTSTGGRASPVCPHRVAAPWGCHHVTAGWSASPSGNLPWSRNRATGTCCGIISKRRNSMPSNSKSVGQLNKASFTCSLVEFWILIGLFPFKYHYSYVFIIIDMLNIL